MDLTSEHPFWSLQNGLLHSYPSLQEDHKCDAVVIGGGISGALTAFHLIEAGVDTILLDKRDIADGSTSGSTALLQYEVDVPLRELIDKIGRKNAARSYQLCYEAVHGIGDLVHRLKISCDYEKRPSLYLARDQNEIPDFEKELRARRELGFAVELWDEQKIRSKFHFTRPAALFSVNAAQVDPHRLTHGLLRSATRLGLRVFDRTNISRFVPGKEGIRVLTSTGKTIRARRAIVAAGFESLKYLSGEAGKLKSTYALISEPTSELHEWHRRSLIWESGSPYLYLRTTRDNRVIVGGEDVRVVNSTVRDALLPHKTKVLLNKFNTLFPWLKLEVAYAWAGTFGETKDGLAYIGSNRSLPHAYFALGFGGNGITYSLIAAKIIRDEFLGLRNPDARLFRFGR